MAQTIGFGDLQNEDDQNNQQNQQPSNTPAAGQAGTQSGGTSASGSTTNNSGQSSGATSAGGAPSGGQTTSQARPATYNQQNQGTGFTNLQNYAEANNPSQLQQTVAKGIENQNQSVLNNLGSSQSQFQQQQGQNQANTNTNQQLVQQVLSNPMAFVNQSQAGGSIGAAAQAAGGAPGTQALQQGNQFSNLLGGQYAGPTALANQSNLSGQAAAAQQTAQGLTTNAGRQTVLQQILGSPNYNTGEQNLDAALLGQGSSPALNTAESHANALNGIINQAGASAQAQGQEQANNAQQFGTQTQGQFGNTVSNLNAQLQQQAGTAQGNQNAAYQSLLSNATGNTLNAQQAALLGLTNGEQITGNVLSGIGADVSQNPLQATAQNVASGQNYATLAALQQLAGSNTPAGAQGILGQYAGQSGQAGSFNAEPQAIVNQNALNNQISSANSAYNAILDPAQNRLTMSNDFYRWANAAGGPNNNLQGVLNAQDLAQAQAEGIDPQAIADVQSGHGSDINGENPAELIGQDLWKNYLQQSGGYKDNSQFLQSSWADQGLSDAQANLANVQNQLNSTYGGMQTINVAQPNTNTNPTQGALAAMANGTMIGNS